MVMSTWQIAASLQKRPLFTRSLSIFESSTRPHFLCCSDEECSKFLPWLERKAGKEIFSVLSIGKSAYGRSLFATKLIRPGDCLLEIPYNAQITKDNLFPEISCLLPVEVGNVARLALAILAEQRKGKYSEWAPYVSCLPEVGEMHNTVFWTETELEMIRQSSVYKETVKKNAHIKKEFSAVKQTLDQFPETFAGVTFEGFRHAYAVVESRAWRSTRGVSLIPFADFVNHDGLSETIVLNDEDKELSEVIADCVYVPGDEVLISYGKFSNAILLLDFGFTVTHNIYDEVKIQVNIPYNDPLHEEKLKLLHKYRTPAVEEGNSFNSSLDVFTIKEVRSIKGKGRGIPQALRAYCRVLCAKSSQELRELADEAMDNDGRLARYPMKNKSKEIEAHRFLLFWIHRLFKEYNRSIEILEPSESLCMNDQRYRRRKMALDLLNGELRVLKSAKDWLENYCANISDS